MPIQLLYANVVHVSHLAPAACSHLRSPSTRVARGTLSVLSSHLLRSEYGSRKSSCTISAQTLCGHRLSVCSILPSQIGQDAVISARRADQVGILAVSVFVHRAKHTGAVAIALEDVNHELLLSMERDETYHRQWLNAVAVCVMLSVVPIAMNVRINTGLVSAKCSSYGYGVRIVLVWVACRRRFFERPLINRRGWACCQEQCR